MARPRAADDFPTIRARMDARRPAAWRDQRPAGTDGQVVGFIADHAPGA